MQRCAQLATLRRFDSKPQPVGQKGPLIPCERRLENMEISENQELTFETVFWKQGLWEAFSTLFGDTWPF